jgi:hypothetical protein
VVYYAQDYIHSTQQAWSSGYDFCLTIVAT